MEEQIVFMVIPTQGAIKMLTPVAHERHICRALGAVSDQCLQYLSFILKAHFRRFFSLNN